MRGLNGRRRLYKYQSTSRAAKEAQQGAHHDGFTIGRAHEQRLHGFVIDEMKVKALNGARFSVRNGDCLRMQLRRSHTAGTILSWIGEVTKIWKDRDLEETYYVDMRVMYTALDLTRELNCTEEFKGDSAALKGKMQLIRSNATTRCYASDILEQVHIAHMSLAAADFPFVGPTQFWLREDVAINTQGNRPLSPDESFSIQVSRNFCHAICLRRGLYLPESETARFCTDCARWFHTSCLGTAVGTVQSLRTSEDGLSLPSWVTWNGPTCDLAHVDLNTVRDVVSMITMPIERGNHARTLPGSLEWVASFESFLIPLREELLAGKFEFSFSERSWGSYVEDRLSKCIVPPRDQDALAGALSYLDVASNIPLSERQVYLCPYNDTHYL